MDEVEQVGLGTAVGSRAGHGIPRADRGSWRIEEAGQVEEGRLRHGGRFHAVPGGEVERRCRRDKSEFDGGIERTIRPHQPGVFFGVAGAVRPTAEAACQIRNRFCRQIRCSHDRPHDHISHPVRGIVRAKCVGVLQIRLRGADQPIPDVGRGAIVGDLAAPLHRLVAILLLKREIVEWASSRRRRPRFVVVGRAVGGGVDDGEIDSQCIHRQIGVVRRVPCLGGVGQPLEVENGKVVVCAVGHQQWFAGIGIEKRAADPCRPRRDPVEGAVERVVPGADVVVSSGGSGERQTRILCVADQVVRVGVRVGARRLRKRGGVWLVEGPCHGRVGVA